MHLNCHHITWFGLICLVSIFTGHHCLYPWTQHHAAFSIVTHTETPIHTHQNLWIETFGEKCCIFNINSDIINKICCIQHFLTKYYIFSAIKTSIVTYINLPFRLLHNIPHMKAPMPSVEQDVPSKFKVLVLTAGNIFPMTIHQFEHTLHELLYTQEGDHDCLIALPFNAFMTKFCVNDLAEDWEEVTLYKLFSMTQGPGTFWDSAITLQLKNSFVG